MKLLQHTYIYLSSEAQGLDNLFLERNECCILWQRAPQPLVLKAYLTYVIQISFAMEALSNDLFLLSTTFQLE